MYGAILGDIIGSPYEADGGNKKKDFPLLGEASHYTDDSVMTAAVGEALMRIGPDADLDTVHSAVVTSMKKWARKHPGAGYGARFSQWLTEDYPAPYGSYGNGAAMRVSAAGWLYPTLERTREIARATAEVSHDHPEGIKGAEAVASAIFLARNGNDKAKIKDYIIKEFGYDLSRTCDEIRPDYRHDPSCQKTVPEAFTAFMEGNDFEDVIRTAVSLGGDTDTLSAIAGSIAEAFYGVPEELKKECVKRLPSDLCSVLLSFWKVISVVDANVGQTSETPEDIRKAIRYFYQNSSQRTLARLLNVILGVMNHDGKFLVAVRGPAAAKIKEGVLTEELIRSFQTLERRDRTSWLVAFTDERELKLGAPTGFVRLPIRTLLQSVMMMDNIEGVAINPWDKGFFLGKNLIPSLFSSKNAPEEQGK